MKNSHLYKVSIILASIFSLFSSIEAQVPEKKDDSNFRLALLGCHKQFEPAPSLVKYVAMKPDLCLWVGDNVYADTKDDPEYLRKCYSALASKPAFQLLKDSYPFLATWDDHDFGLNNAGKYYPLKDSSKFLFREFWGLEEEIPENRDGIYYSKTISLGKNKLQLIMLDVRYNRDDPGDEGDVLGENQWKWLEKVLEEPADLRLMVSGFQIMLDRSSRSETWAKFPKARKRLFETIKQSKADRLLFITGDQHYGEVNRMEGVLDFDGIELQFAGINQIEDPEFNSFRVSEVCSSLHSYAMLDIQWDSTDFDIPHLLFRVFNAVDDQMEVSYRVNFSELDRKIVFSQPLSFSDKKEIVLTPTVEGLDIYYTLDGSYPSGNSNKYISPFTIEETTEVKAALFDSNGMQVSAIQDVKFQEVKPYPSIKVKNLQKGLKYQYFEGRFSRLPDFSKIPPIKNGISNNLEILELAEREDSFAISFYGFIEVAETAYYTFHCISDDGSRLYIQDSLVIDNDGSHSAREKYGFIALEKGLHSFRLDYFDDYMSQKLELYYTASDGIRREVPSNWFFHNPKNN